MRIKFYVLVFSVLTATASMASSPDWREKLSSDSPPIVFDVSLFGVNSNILKKAALVAMVRRKWVIESIEDTFVTGKYASAKVMINFESAEKITIGYLKFYDPMDKKWLLNLKKDMLYESARCGNFE